MNTSTGSSSAEHLLSKQEAAGSVPARCLIHYVVVRDDLPKGHMAAQLVHAAGESPGTPAPDGTHAIALQASPKDLLDLMREVRIAGIPHSEIVENDEPWKGQLMALGFAPVDRDSSLRRSLKRFRLVH